MTNAASSAMTKPAPTPVKTTNSRSPHFGARLERREEMAGKGLVALIRRIPRRPWGSLGHGTR